MNQSKEMTKLAIAALEDKKANDVRVIDMPVYLLLRIIL